MSQDHDPIEIEATIVQRIEDGCDRFEAAWRKGENPRVEDYWSAGDGSAYLRELLVLDLIYRKKRGEPPTHADYGARFASEPTAVVEAFRAANLPLWETEEPRIVDSTLISGMPLPGGVSVAPAFPDPSSRRFRILRLVARGGLGEVFAARDEDLSRDVALKTIQDRHADDPDSRSRFRLEAEITGRLEHPGIVPIHALGTDAFGKPFYVMRFIRGESLQEAIKNFHRDPQAMEDTPERRLQLRALLRRFVDVCNAIAYAHQKNIIHRDIKPANIMLGDYGETLVVDWGLAKSAGEQGEAASPPESVSSRDSSLTRAGTCIGTPSYMSPEMAEGRAERSGTAGDVYGLGATLYQILAGCAPFTGSDVHATLDRVRRGDFPRPTTLVRGVPKALEAICLRAMSRNPDERYASPTAIAEDIEHWLADEAVSAYRDPPSLRLARWARRHRPAVVGIASILVSALIATTVGAVLIGREAERKEEQRQLAQENFQLARAAVDRMLTQVAEVELADVPQMQGIRKRLLAEALEFHESFLKRKGDDPTVRQEAARAHLRIGEIEELLGDHIKAEEEYRKGIAGLHELSAALAGGIEVLADKAKGHDQLGMLLKNANRFSEAEAQLRVAYRTRVQLTAFDPENRTYAQELVDTGYHLASLLARRPKGNQEDENAYREAVRLQESLVAETKGQKDANRKLSRYLNNLAMLLAAKGRRDEAEKHYRDSIAILDEYVDIKPPAPGDKSRLARTCSNLAALLWSERRLDEAEALCLKARDLQRGLRTDFPDVPDYRRELASTLNNLGLIHRDEDRDSDAETDFREALALSETLAGEHDGNVAHRLALSVTRLNLSGLLEKKRPDQAAEHLGEALRVHEQLANAYPNVAEYKRILGRSLFSLARLRAEGGDNEVAGLLERARDIHRSVLQANPDDRVALEFLADDLGVLCIVELRRLSFEKAADAADELPRLLPDDPTQALRASAFLSRCALESKQDRFAVRAIAVLRTAVDRRVLNDPDALEIEDLDPLRSLEEFQRLVKVLKDRRSPRGG